MNHLTKLTQAEFEDYMDGDPWQLFIGARSFAPFLVLPNNTILRTFFSMSEPEKYSEDFKEDLANMVLFVTTHIKNDSPLHKEALDYKSYAEDTMKKIDMWNAGTEETIKVILNMSKTWALKYITEKEFDKVLDAVKPFSLREFNTYVRAIRCIK